MKNLKWWEIALSLAFVGLLAWWKYGAPDSPEEKQVQAWCKYNTAERFLYKDYTIGHPDAYRIPGGTEKMLNDLRPQLKAERDKLLGTLSDEQFGLLQMKADKEGWYKDYCGS